MAARGGPKGPKGNNKLLALLREHGFKDELPASTVSWFSSNPTLQWLASHLSDANVNDPATQALYEAHLADADGLDVVAGDAGQGADAGGAPSSWLNTRTADDLQQAIQVRPGSLPDLMVRAHAAAHGCLRWGGVGARSPRHAWPAILRAVKQQSTCPIAELHCPGRTRTPAYGC